MASLFREMVPLVYRPDVTLLLARLRTLPFLPGLGTTQQIGNVNVPSSTRISLPAVKLTGQTGVSLVLQFQRPAGFPTTARSLCLLPKSWGRTIGPKESKKVCSSRQEQKDLKLIVSLEGKKKKIQKKKSEVPEFRTARLTVTPTLPQAIAFQAATSRDLS